MWGSPSKLDVLIQIPADLPLLFYLESVIEMVEPKQACPRCGADLGRLLYCTPLKDIKLVCPNCGLRVQMKCTNCGNWMVLVEKYCGKCGAKNPCFYQPNQ